LNGKAFHPIREVWLRRYFDRGDCRIGGILGLAALNAFTNFKIETWGLVAIAGIVLIGTVAFGFFSLWELPRIVARFQKHSLH
jgi:hypothetical protein